MKLPNCPKVDDFLRFKTHFTFTSDGTEYPEIDKGTIVKVIIREFHGEDWAEELQCKLIISVPIDGVNRMFKFDYSVHQESVEIIEDLKALKLLYKG